MRKFLTCLMVLVLLAPNALRADEKKNAANNSKDSYLPVYQVKATAMDDNTVKACWSWSEIIPDKLLVNFESGDLSDTDFDNTVSNYPWVITENACDGTYAIKSSNEGKPNSTSAIEITVDVPYNGVMGFNCRVSSETEYDLGRFYIDDVLMLEMSGFKMWQYREYEITEGTHTYRWEYKKDNGTDKEEDAFFLDNVKLFGEVEPFAGGWVTYSDTAYVESVSPGYNVPMWWGIKFPRTESYKDMVLSAISVFDGEPGAGSYTANIFIGGDDAPATLVSTQAFSLTGKEEFVDVELATPVVIEGDQPLWITLHSVDIFAPASGCEYADDINSDWLSLDGTNWGHLKSDYDFHYSWMIKGYIENKEGKRIELAKERNNRAEFNSYKVYRYECFAGEMSDETVTLLAENVTDTMYMDYQWSNVNVKDGTYQWGVSAVYDGNNESTITWSNIVDKNMIAEVNVNVTTNNDKTAEGTLVRFINKSEPGMEYDYEVVLDETGTHTWKKFRKGIYEVTISNAGYNSCYESDVMEIWDNTTLNCELEEIVAAVNLYVSPTGWAMWNEDNDNDNALNYDVYLNNTFVEKVTTAYFQHTDVVVGQSYTTKVIANYATGVSDPMTYTWTFKDCENYEGVSDFTVKYANNKAVLNWNVPGIDVSQEPQTLSYSFETDLDQWTTIDANNDGHVWYHSLQANEHEVDPVEGHTGTGYICSESFCNAFSALTPDDYIVSPEKIVATPTSKITFWASAQDAAYAAEHFGVAVSTDGNTSADDFTTLSEWTLTAKSAPKAQRGTRDQGNWYQYEADLSSYEGQEIWVAIRHFNTTDMFILLVDDVELVDVALMPELKDESLALGAFVYRDGELLNTEPIRTGRFSEPMPVETEREYCIRVVYGGEKDDTYYAMSCPDCETLFAEMLCDAPEDLYGVQSANEQGLMGVRLVWPYAAPTTNWLYYDNGLKLDGIGGPETFLWGVMFPAESLIGYEGTSLTKVTMYANAMSSGFIYIYSGGITTPSSMLHAQQYATDGTAEDFEEFELTVPVELDITKNLWIVFSTNTGTIYPAGAAKDCGDPNSRWISMDGYTWEDMSIYGLNYSWMVRGYVSDNDKLGGETRALQHYNIYRGSSENDFELIDDTTEKTYFDLVNEGTYYYQVTAVYEQEGIECESDPANAYENEEQDYIIVVVKKGESLGENTVVTMVYPNPAKDVLNINAEAMTRVSIMNTLGQTVYDKAVDTDDVVLDMTQFESGVYMLRITTENGVATQRIMVNN